MYSDSQEFVWTANDHRDFAAAVFDDGICKSSPAVILDTMACADCNIISIAKVKSHLQKYRVNKERNREEFLASYDAWMNRVNKIIGELNVPRGTTVTAHDWRAQNTHLVFQLRALMNPENHSMGETAACLSFHALMRDKLNRSSARAFKMNSFPGKISIGERGNQLSNQPAGNLVECKSLVYPKLTQEEKTSPLGQCLESTKHLLSAFKNLVGSHSQVQSRQSRVSSNEASGLYKTPHLHEHQDLANKFTLFDASFMQSSWPSASHDFTGHYDSPPKAIAFSQTSNTSEVVPDSVVARPALNDPHEAANGFYSFCDHADRYANSRKRPREAICMPISPLLRAESSRTTWYVEDSSTSFASETGFDENTGGSKARVSTVDQDHNVYAQVRLERLPEAYNYDGLCMNHSCNDVTRQRCTMCISPDSGHGQRRSHGFQDECINRQKRQREALSHTNSYFLSTDVSSQSSSCFDQRSSSSMSLTEFDGYDIKDHLFPEHHQYFTDTRNGDDTISTSSHDDDWSVNLGK